MSDTNKENKEILIPTDTFFQQLGQMLDVRFKPLDTRLTRLEEGQAELKQDVAGLKQGQANIEQEIIHLKTSMKILVPIL